MAEGAWPYPAPEDDGGANHLVPGLVLPPVALPATRGHVIDLSAQAGRAVLFVYPWTGRPGLPNPPAWDNIPGAHGSTPEAEGFRDLHTAFLAKGIKVYGLSGQDSAHQQELASRIALPYSLLSDVQKAFSTPLRLPSFETGGETYLRRLTLILRDGAIQRTFYPVHPPHTHAAEVLALV